MDRFHWFFNPLRSPDEAVAPTPPATETPAAPTEQAPKAQTDEVSSETKPVEGEAKIAEPAKAEGEAEGNGSLIPEGEEKKEGEEAKPEAGLAEPLDLTKLALPEGMKADDPGLTKAVEILRDTKLTEAQRVEALASTYSEGLKTVADSAAKTIYDNYSAMNKQWQNEVKADPVIGGDNQPEALRTIAKAIDAWSPDAKAARQALALTGAGNHPAVLRTLHAMAVALSEGGPAQGALPQGKKTAVDLLYGGSSPGTQ